MDFFNKVGETISSKSKDVAKKAKDLAEITSMNSKISSQEEKIKQIYIALGKSVYEQEIKADAEIAEKCSEIDAAYSEIERMRQDIMVLKGIKKCPECGTAVAVQSTFCSGCGAKIPVEAENTKTYEETQEASESYTEVNEGEAEEEAEEETEGGTEVESGAESEVEDITVQTVVFCAGCGKENVPDADFCAECGSPMKE